VENHMETREGALRVGFKLIEHKFNEREDGLGEEDCDLAAAHSAWVKDKGREFFANLPSTRRQRGAGMLD
jgi:hypothetical protein